MENIYTFDNQLEGTKVTQEEGFQKASDRVKESMKFFMETGMYGKMKNAEAKKKQYQEALRKKAEQLDGLRYEFPDQQMVMKFVAKSVYHWDYYALNDYLRDIGILPLVVDIDTKAVKQQDSDLLNFLSHFEEPQTYSLSASFNKKGKELWQLEEAPLPESSMEWYVEQIKAYNIEWTNLQEHYETIKQQAEDVLYQGSDMKLYHDYGSFYLRKKPVSYDIDSILEFEGMGMNFLIQYGKPNPKKLESFFLDGVLKQSDLCPFRKEIDRKVDFMVMEKEKEDRVFGWFSKKNQIASQNYAKGSII
ncbi:hypothetical protein [Salibacterium aidingense]|uniref:hypothetical protein n=1 Tax=Salibacterium aidingense TaxID=384933 RepID=UPI0004018510|nr:hypothetical protein [Salibacterium aidingense]